MNQTLKRAEADKVWATLWASLQTEWFKLEVLQDYTAEDQGPSLSAWLKGDKELSMTLLKKRSMSGLTCAVRRWQPYTYTHC